MITKIDKYKYANFSLERINGVFVEACTNGDLELVKYLLLNKNIKNAEMNSYNYMGILRACGKNHNHIVKYLLTSKELSKTISMNINKGSLLMIAVQNGNVELMEFLLENNKKMNLNQNDDQIFKWLLYNFNTKQEMIKLLITDFGLIKTPAISDFLEEKSYHIENRNTVKKWFEQRESAETMTYVFNDDAKEQSNIIKKRIKI